jgi:hypothetical protein
LAVAPDTASALAAKAATKGRLGSRLGFVGDGRVPASAYIHPEFGFFCPTPRLRRRLRVALACLVVAGVGAAVMATADGPKLAVVVTRVDETSIAETSPATGLAPFAAVVLPIVAGAQTTADKPSCVGDSRAEGNCVSVKLRKPRMVWVANHRPAIAAVALGRSAAPTTGSIDAALLAARTGSQGDPARPGEAAAAAASSTEPQSYAQEQESAEVGAQSEPSPRPVPAWRAVLARGPGRRLGSARLRAKGARLPAGRIRSRGLHAQFLVKEETEAASIDDYIGQDPACRDDQYCTDSAAQIRAVLDQIDGPDYMLTSIECRSQAEEKIRQAERQPRHRTRLLTAAQAWLILAGQMRRLEAAISSAGEIRSKIRAD